MRVVLLAVRVCLLVTGSVDGRSLEVQYDRRRRVRDYASAGEASPTTAGLHLVTMKLELLAARVSLPEAVRADVRRSGVQCDRRLRVQDFVSAGGASLQVAGLGHVQTISPHLA